jgi:hypothetical protein
MLSVFNSPLVPAAAAKACTQTHTLGSPSVSPVVPGQAAFSPAPTSATRVQAAASLPEGGYRVSSLPVSSPLVAQSYPITPQRTPNTTSPRTGAPSTGEGRRSRSRPEPVFERPPPLSSPRRPGSSLATSVTTPVSFSGFVSATADGAEAVVPKGGNEVSGAVSVIAGATASQVTAARESAPLSAEARDLIARLQQENARLVAENARLVAENARLTGEQARMQALLPARGSSTSKLTGPLSSAMPVSGGAVPPLLVLHRSEALSPSSPSTALVIGARHNHAELEVVAHEWSEHANDTHMRLDRLSHRLSQCMERFMRAVRVMTNAESASSLRSTEELDEIVRDGVDSMQQWVDGFVLASAHEGREFEVLRQKHTPYRLAQRSRPESSISSRSSPLLSRASPIPESGPLWARRGPDSEQASSGVLTFASRAGSSDHGDGSTLAASLKKELGQQQVRVKELEERVAALTEEKLGLTALVTEMEMREASWEACVQRFEQSWREHCDVECAEVAVEAQELLQEQLAESLETMEVQIVKRLRTYREFALRLELEIKELETRKESLVNA